MNKAPREDACSPHGAVQGPPWPCVGALMVAARKGVRIAPAPGGRPA